MTSPTARSLQYCRDQGWTAGVVERWIERSRTRLDLFGVIDLIVLADWYSDGDLLVRDSRMRIIGVQATSSSNHAARRTKAVAEPRLREWLETGARYEVWSWRKYAKPVERKYWRLRREAVTLADLT